MSCAEQPKLDVYGTKCGYFSDVENCRPSTACVVDMYIDDKADLPWNTETRFDSMYGRKSKALLFSQYPNDKPAYLREVTALNAVNIQVQSISQSLCTFKVIINPFLWHAKTLGKG
jgi:hypothetical protein